MLLFIEELEAFPRTMRRLKEIANHFLDAHRARRTAVLAPGFQAHLLAEGYVDILQPDLCAGQGAVASPNAARSPPWQAYMTWRSPRHCPLGPIAPRRPACRSMHGYNAFIQETEPRHPLQQGQRHPDYIPTRRSSIMRTVFILTRGRGLGWKLSRNTLSRRPG